MEVYPSNQYPIVNEFFQRLWDAPIIDAAKHKVSSSLKTRLNAFRIMIQKKYIQFTFYDPNLL